MQWLATGALPREPSKLMSAEHHVLVPLYDVRTATGVTAFFDAGPSDQSILLPRAWTLQHAGTTSTRLAFVHMYGDAMAPDILNDDLLMIDRAQETLSDGVYVFYVGGFMFIQRFVFKPGEPSPMPEPGEYSERTGPVGRVVWKGRRL